MKRLLEWQGLKAATYLGLAGKEVGTDEVEVFETKPLFEQAEELKHLPKVAYAQMLQFPRIIT